MRSRELSPLEQSWVILRKNPERPAIAFYAVLLLLMICLASIHVLPQMQKMAMRKFHYMPRPFYEWAIWQFLPSMYNFHNEILISPRMLVSDFQFPVPDDVLRFSVNHYPFRMIPFGLARSQVFLRMPFYVYTRSVFRNQSIMSSYTVTLLGYAIHVTLLNAYEHSR